MFKSFAATPVAAFFLAASSLMVPVAASASARIGLDPLQVTLPARTLTANVNLRNRGKQPATFQAEVLEWTQVDGKDVLTPTRELVVAPPVFKMARDGVQTVRIGRLKPGVPGAVEKTYRLALTESPSEAETRVNKVGTALRVTLPVFVPPASAQPTSLDWTASRSSAATNDLALNVSNLGNTTAKITRVSLLQNGRQVASMPQSLYVLPGVTRPLAWRGALRQAVPGQPLELLTEFGNRKTLSQPLELQVVTVVPR